MMPVTSPQSATHPETCTQRASLGCLRLQSAKRAALSIFLSHMTQRSTSQQLATLMVFNGQQIPTTVPFPWVQVHHKGRRPAIPPPGLPSCQIYHPTDPASTHAGDIAYKKFCGHDDKQTVNDISPPLPISIAGITKNNKYNTRHTCMNETKRGTKHNTK